MLRRTACTIVGTILFAGALLSQVNTRHYSQENGLISNTIYASLSDSRGYLWFSSDQGVSRFDGHEFVNYTIDEGLTDNEVLKLFEDSQERIWFLTYNGQPCYYQYDSIHNPSNTSFLRNFTNENFFTHLVEDSNHCIWFFKEGGRTYYKLDNETLFKFDLPPFSFYQSSFHKDNIDYIVYKTKITNSIWKYAIADQTNSSVSIISFDDSLEFSNFHLYQNEIYFFGKQRHNAEGISIYKSDNFRFDDRNEITIWADNQIDKILTISEIRKELYCATNNGVLALKDQESPRPPLLSGIFITSITEDFEKGLWFTTKTDGIYYLPNLTTPYYQEIKESITLIKQNPFDTNEYYFSGLNTFIKTKGTKKESWSLPENFGLNEITSDIAFMASDHVLIGNGRGLCLFNNSVFQILQNTSGIKQILMDGDSIVFARSNDVVKQHVEQLFQPQDIFNQPFRTLYAGRTLSVLKSGKNDYIIGDNFGAHTLLENGEKAQLDSIHFRIKRIVKSTHNYQAYCSDINGIYLKSPDKSRHFTRKNGLISNRINSAAFDSHDNLWIATPKGLSYINTETGTIKNYGSINGIADERVDDLLIMNDSTILLATCTGVYVFNPDKPIESSIPRLEIQQIKVNGGKRNLTSLGELASAENNIEVLLSGISFNNPLEFYYQIGTGEWTKMTGRLLTFVNLPPGRYNVNIRCQNHYGQLSANRSLEITISPPFFKSWWFISGFLLISIAGGIGIVTTYQRRKTREKNIELILSETKQKALRAQLNPHFVFNALNSIQYLYISHKEDLALEYLNKFSVLLRNTLRFSDKAYVTIHEELDNLSLYLEIEQMRTENQFEYSFHVGENVDAFLLLIPSMLIQPFVENSIWHGFKGLHKKGNVQVSISKIDTTSIAILISDNGTGFNATNIKDVEGHANELRGMKLIRERINALNSMSEHKMNLTIVSDTNGTKVQLICQIKY